MKIVRISTIPLSLNVLLKGQLKFLNKYFRIFGISSSGDMLNEVEKREGIRVHAVEMERGISPLKDFISLIKLYVIFRKEKPQIIHSITPKAGLLSMLAGRFAKVPIRMHTFTGLIFPSKSGLLQKILIQMDKILCASATNIYPEGQGVKKDLIDFNITKKPLKVLANGNVNGIDLTYFDPIKISTEDRRKLKKSLGIEDNDFVFIFVGRLVGDKGINELINAFSNMKCSNTKLLLVGPFEEKLDPLEPETLSQIKSNNAVISVGYQQDVRSYFGISNALIFPSYREGFPNVVMQAGAMELPAIVSNINGCNEIIIEGKNGTIIPVKDVGAIKNAMEMILTDEVRYSQMKANARKMIADRYGQQVVWDALLKEYKTLLKEKGLDDV